MFDLGGAGVSGGSWWFVLEVPTRTFARQTGGFGRSGGGVGCNRSPEQPTAGRKPASLGSAGTG